MDPHHVVNMPVTRPVYGSTYTVSLRSPSPGWVNTTCVVASGPPTMTADTAPVGCAARAAATCTAKGSAVPATRATVRVLP